MSSLDDPDVRAFIRRSKVVEVATLSPANRPFVTPVWFVLDGGTVYITTGPGTWAGRNIQRRPAVTLLFNADDGRRSDVLRVRGTASCHQGLPPWRVLLRIVAKYYLSPPALRVELRNRHKWRLRTRYYGQTKGGLGHLRVVPTAYEFLTRP